MQQEEEECPLFWIEPSRRNGAMRDTGSPSTACGGMLEGGTGASGEAQFADNDSKDAPPPARVGTWKDSNEENLQEGECDTQKPINTEYPIRW